MTTAVPVWKRARVNDGNPATLQRFHADIDSTVSLYATWDTSRGVWMLQHVNHHTRKVRVLNLYPTVTSHR